MITVGRDKGFIFVDEDGVRWTVVPIPAGRVLGAGPVGLQFTSETGERRVAGRLPAAGMMREDRDTSALRALLREALLVT
jgi:hypothetical protein